MSNKGKGRQHVNVLVVSLRDHVHLCVAVDTRYRELCEMHRRVKHLELIPPTHLDRDIILWRQMFVRHAQGDYRNTMDELRSVRRIAEWTLRVKSELVDQKAPEIQWRDG